MPEETRDELIETDVAVIGAGGAGLSAAIEARKTGAEVTVLCRKGMLANNTAIAGGVFPLIGTPLQKDRGIQDSPDIFARDLLRINSHTVDEKLIDTATRGATELYEWLTGFGVQFRDLVGFAGHSVLRCHAEVAWKGANVVTALVEAARKMGVDFHYGSPATDLIMSKDGGVIGVKAQNSDGKPIQIKVRRGVVLAAGGFGRNQEMMRKYVPEFSHLPVMSAAGSTGDGIRMALDAGAQTANMNSVVMYAASEMKKRRTVFWLYIVEGGILVNKNAQRFIDESIGYARTAVPVARQPGGMAFMVFDEKISAKVRQADVRRSVESYTKDGVVVEDSTVEGLAVKMNVDPAALKNTMAKLPFQGQLYAIPVIPCVIQTHGGVKTNTAAQVISKQGNPIPRLYAAGDNAMGLGGPATEDEGCPGYVTGTGYIDAFVFGRIAGRNAARENAAPTTKPKP